MKGFITNNKIFELIKNGQVKEAMQMTIKAAPKSTRDKLRQRFSRDSVSVEDDLISGLILGDFFYDYIRIDPTVIKAVDFSRSADLDNVFAFSSFARNIEALPQNEYLGNINQIQGYVAEQIAAWQLQSQGHEIFFPETSNQAGYDLLVDGKQFQVKCVTDPQHIINHFEKYPHIPVIANIDLADHMHDMDIDNVYFMPHLVHSEIVKQTTDSLHYASELQDFEVPWITAMVSSGINLRLLYRQETDWIHALTNVGGDVASKTFGAWVGQHGVSAIGGFLFGPAGYVVGGLSGAILGTRWARNVTKGIKSTFTYRQCQLVEEACIQLLNKSALLLNNKLTAKNDKKAIVVDSIDVTKSETNKQIEKWVDNQFNEDINYYLQKQKQLFYYANDFNKLPGENIQEQALRTIDLFLQVAIHPAAIQPELTQLFDAIRELKTELRANRLSTDNRLENMEKQLTNVQIKQDDLSNQQLENTELLLDKMEQIQKSHEDSLIKMEQYSNIYEMHINDMDKRLQQFCLESIDNDRKKIDEFYYDLNCKQVKMQKEIILRFEAVENSINKFAHEIEDKIIKNKEAALQSQNLLDENKIIKIIQEYQSQYRQAPATAIKLLANGSYLYDIYKQKQKSLDLSFEDLIIIKYGKALEKIMFEKAKKRGYNEPKNESSMGHLRYYLRFIPSVDEAVNKAIQLRNKSAHPDVISEDDILLMRTILFQDKLIEKLLNEASYKKRYI